MPHVLTKWSIHQADRFVARRRMRQHATRPGDEPGRNDLATSTNTCAPSRREAGERERREPPSAGLTRALFLLRHPEPLRHLGDLGALGVDRLLEFVRAADVHHLAAGAEALADHRV